MTILKGDDHIIRDETGYLAKWNNIDTKPVRWAEDEYIQNNPSGGTLCLKSK